MARIFLDGFNTGDGSMWDYSVGTFLANRAGFGAYCMQLATSAASIKKTLSTTYNSLYFKWRFEPSGWLYIGNAYCKFGLKSGSTCVGYLAFSSAGVLSWYTGSSFSGGTLRATSSIPIVLGRVYLMELYIVPHTSSGTLILKIDGVTAINFTGQTSYSPTTIDTFGFGSWDTSGYPESIISDVVVDDANWIGNTRIGYRQISGAGNYAEWSPLTGANYTNVDELPPSSTDFNYSNTSNQRDTFAVGALQVGTAGYTVNSIKCIAPSVRHHLTGSPTPTHIGNMVRISGTDDVKGSFSPGVAAAMSQSIWEQIQLLLTLGPPQTTLKSAISLLRS